MTTPPVSRATLSRELLPLGLAFLAAGLSLALIGPFLARTIVRRVRPHTYALLIDLVLLTAAGGMFVAMWT